MEPSTVTMVRIYQREKDGVDGLARYLREEIGVQGLTVFRGVLGHGSQGEVRSDLLSLSLDLPVVIEFYDRPGRVARALEGLADRVTPGHVVTWTASVWDGSR